MLAPKSSSVLPTKRFPIEHGIAKLHASISMKVSDF